MGNYLEIELYKELRTICQQAKSELLHAYHYFEKKHDPNGVCILYHEICDIYGLFGELDGCDPKRDPNDLYVPSVYEWGLYNWGADSQADATVMLAIEQKNIKSNQKIYMENGCFYGYYCYNIYNKCLGWINYAIKNYQISTAFNQLVVDHFESAMQYFMRYENKR